MNGKTKVHMQAIACGAYHRWPDTVLMSVLNIDLVTCHNCRRIYKQRIARPEVVAANPGVDGKLFI